tara:strand:+ start:1786 stop:2577 length:792 start_codon:yes stop_codon:yes gene_type:complete
MFGGHFYHEKTKKAVALFGRLFNNLYVIRKNSSGAVISQVKVPLSYAPKQKFLERIRENPDLNDDTKVAIKLPRMSFEITAITYDATRQLAKIGNFTTIASDGSNNKRQKFFNPVPYNINFQLNAYAKSQDDALQIVEQILPTFNPQYALTIKPFQTEFPDFKEDIQVIINGVSFSDDFEGAMEQRRTIIYSMDFEMKLSFHGPINNTAIIRDARAKIFDIKAGLQDSDLGLETIVVTPNPTNVIGLDDSTFGFSTTILDSVS